MKASLAMILCGALAVSQMARAEPEPGELSGNHRLEKQEPLPAPGHRPRECDEPPRPVLLGTGLHIDLVCFGPKANVTTTVGTQQPNSDGKFYTIITYDVGRGEEDSASLVLVYQPNANWAVPTTSLDSMGAYALSEGSLDSSDHAGWVKQADSRFDHSGQAWLPARQIVMRKPSASEWVYYRIIRDTRHDLLYVLYQRDDDGGAGQANRLFDSFAVDPGAFTVDAGGAAAGAHLPQPYPNP